MTTENSAAIDRTIYPMPMFVSMAVSDLKKAEETYHAVGFITLAAIPGRAGQVQLLHLRRERYQDILLTQGEVVCGSMAVSFAAGGEDVDALALRLRESGQFGGSVDGPMDTPWFTRDITITDPDGNRIVLTAMRPAEHDAAAAWLQENATGECCL